VVTPGATPQAAGAVRLTAWLHGRVQGVGMRWWVRAQALELGLVGWARNTDDQRVEVVAEGPDAAAQELLRRLEHRDGGPWRRPGRVTHVAARWSRPRADLTGFEER
jgi:acylphosphatase